MSWLRNLNAAQSFTAHRRRMPEHFWTIRGSSKYWCASSTKLWLANFVAWNGYFQVVFRLLLATLLGRRSIDDHSESAWCCEREYTPSNPASLTGLTTLEPSGARKLRLGGAFAKGGAGGRDLSCAGRTTGLHVTVLISKRAAQVPMAPQVKFVACRP